MTKIIAFINQKGGVSKTTSTVSLAAALSNKGFRVLAIDIDGQANLTRIIHHELNHKKLS
jgi:chromosome partitioning protein